MEVRSPSTADVLRDWRRDSMSVLRLVAVNAQRNTVGNIKAEIGIVSPALDVMRVDFCADDAALAAAVAISAENGQSPRLSTEAGTPQLTDGPLMLVVADRGAISTRVTRVLIERLTALQARDSLSGCQRLVGALARTINSLRLLCAGWGGCELDVTHSALKRDALTLAGAKALGRAVTSATLTHAACTSHERATAPFTVASYLRGKGCAPAFARAVLGASFGYFAFECRKRRAASAACLFGGKANTLVSGTFGKSFRHALLRAVLPESTGDPTRRGVKSCAASLASRVRQCFGDHKEAPSGLGVLAEGTPQLARRGHEKTPYAVVFPQRLNYSTLAA